FRIHATKIQQRRATTGTGVSDETFTPGAGLVGELHQRDPGRTRAGGEIYIDLVVVEPERLFLLEETVNRSGCGILVFPTDIGPDVSAIAIGPLHGKDG